MAFLMFLSCFLTSDLPIVVQNTWQPAYAADIQDISYGYFADSYHLFIRRNADGVIYLADPHDCTFQGEIPLPSGYEGFGLAWSENNGGQFYVDCSLTGSISYSNGSDSWVEFPSPLGNAGAGMSFDPMFFPEIFQISDTPCVLYSIAPDGSTHETHSVPDVTDEVSGFMAYEIAADGEPPGAMMITTRFGHMFNFYVSYAGGSIQLYEQEPCPLTVQESLGLAWNTYNATVYWSWKGTDDLYYISELWIPIFGAVEDDLTAVNPVCNLTTAANPSSGSAEFIASVAANGMATLQVYDVSGRLVDTIHSGMLPEGRNSFTFNGPPGLYLAVLKHQGGMETTKVVLTN